MSTPTPASPSPFDSLPELRPHGEALAKTAHHCLLQLALVSARFYSPTLPFELLDGLHKGGSSIHWTFDVFPDKAVLSGSMLHGGLQLNLLGFAFEVDHTLPTPPPPPLMGGDGPAMH